MGTCQCGEDKKDLKKTKIRSIEKEFKLSESDFSTKQTQILRGLPGEVQSQFQRQKQKLFEYCNQIETDIKKMKKQYEVVTKPGRNFNETFYFTKNLDLTEVNKVIGKECEKIGSGSAVMKEYNSLRGGGDDEYMPGYFMQYDLDADTLSNKLNEQMKCLYEMENLIKYNKDITSNLQSVKSFDLLKQNFQTIFSELQEKTRSGNTLTKSKDFQFIDVVIVMDTTGSMSQYLEKAKEQSTRIFQDLKKRYNNAEFNYAFIGYKDHSDKEQMLKIIDFEKEISKVTDKISQIQAKGGDDAAEAMHDALMAAAKLKWRKTSHKFVFVICDSPPHGKEYGCPSDNYPEGCPCDIELPEIVSIYKKKNININLKKATHANLYETQRIFKQKFPESLYNCSNIRVRQFAQTIAKDVQDKFDDLLKIKQKMTAKFIQVAAKSCEKMKNILQNVMIEYQNLKLNKKTDQIMVKIKEQCQQQQVNFRQMIKKYTLNQTSLSYQAAFQYMLQIHADKQKYIATKYYLNVMKQLEMDKQQNKRNVQNALKSSKIK